MPMPLNKEQSLDGRIKKTGRRNPLVTCTVLGLFNYWVIILPKLSDQFGSVQGYVYMWTTASKCAYVMRNALICVRSRTKERNRAALARTQLLSWAALPWFTSQITLPELWRNLTRKTRKLQSVTHKSSFSDKKNTIFPMFRYWVYRSGFLRTISSLAFPESKQ